MKIMRIALEKAGTNPDQAPHAFVEAPMGVDDVIPLTSGEVFHISGQPEDVWWRVRWIETAR